MIVELIVVVIVEVGDGGLALHEEDQIGECGASVDEGERGPMDMGVRGSGIFSFSLIEGAAAPRDPRSCIATFFGPHFCWMTPRNWRKRLGGASCCPCGRRAVVRSRPGSESAKCTREGFSDSPGAGLGASGVDAA